MMSGSKATKAIVVGSGPNGLAAAITLAKAGLQVSMYERNVSIGGACASAELIKPGYIHDVGSAVHPLAISSPFFRNLSLKQYGLEWTFPPSALAHPLDDGSAIILNKSVKDSAETLDYTDRKAYQVLMEPLVKRWEDLVDNLMFFPRLSFNHIRVMLRFGKYALFSAHGLAKNQFSGTRGRALFAGLGVHSVMRMDTNASAAAGLMLGIAAHASGWPFPVGGSQKITDAMAGYFSSLGGEIITGFDIKTIEQLPPHSKLLLDITPLQFLHMANTFLPEAYKNKLINYRYGPGVFKMDWILDGPIPWKASECLTAGTVHLGGQLEEIIAAENEVWCGKHPAKPFVLLSQPSLFDKSRINNSGHNVWAYCHVPNGSTIDMTERIEAQIERFAPGFKERIVGRKTASSNDLEQDNPNCVGGDITGGKLSFKRLVFPDISYNTPIKNTFLCSSTVPPGPGVHGMCGFRAAQIALKT
jgi:phytoene dehydrogenase-like protein